ncbi:Pimeloyl-ACP methyl ester carboxylesterase [Loktanella fryxellensis]|uniref:Pimeloyl-ACP methyl ester carboxylesterase n=1 Tax=Loktanella fryxellensis TaxID=245187 RepID=A0A1H8FZ12_9RHOB|nr:alpha/beta hydrolase [Loktanella fryxellensis]SEN36477.1 Pimeloyl-ACP methyl ester carboxylesterase [Loktanella fryxellensis]
MRWLIVLVFLAGCSPALLRTSGATDPMITSAARLAEADKVVIFIPGALSSVMVFKATEAWEEAGYARAFYRYPGLDGLPVDHRLDPATAARDVAAFANEMEGKTVTLVGYSTGALIALEAAPQIDPARQVRIAAMSPAVEHGGGPRTLIRGAGDALQAVRATGSLDKNKLWPRFWAGLLFGPEALEDPVPSPELLAAIAEGAKVGAPLDTQIAFSHMLSLPGWTLPQNLDLSGIPVAFFIGLNDPVFSTRQTTDFSRKLGGVPILGYPGQGHLLFLTRPDVFTDMLDFAEGRPFRLR